MPANLDTLGKDGPISVIPLLSPQQMPRSLSKTMDVIKGEEDARIMKVLLDIGILVLEGRTADRTSKRGFVEGVHCVTNPRAHTHRCDLNDYMCKRMEKYQQLTKLIWNENKGLCIELRIKSDCSCGEEQVRKNTMSRFDYVLEQWYFEVTNVRNCDEDIGVMNWYGLLQAIRSQIHFSQLVAWWSSNRAQLPKNISFHVLPLSQIDVDTCSLQHKFPGLSFSTTYLQVKVRSQPRSKVLPKIFCPVHRNWKAVVDDRMKIHCDRFGKHHCESPDNLDELENNETWFDDGILNTSTEDRATFLNNVINNDKTQAVMKNTVKCRYSVIDRKSNSTRKRRNECCKMDKRTSVTFQKNSNEFSMPVRNPSTVFSRRTSYEPTKSKHLLRSCNCDNSDEDRRENKLNYQPPLMRCGRANICNFTENSGVIDLDRREDEKQWTSCCCENCIQKDWYSNGERARRNDRLDSSCLFFNDCNFVTDAFYKTNVLPLQNTTSLEDNNNMNKPDNIICKRITNLQIVDRIPSENKEARERRCDRLNFFIGRCSRTKKLKDRFLPFAGNVVESILSGRVYFIHFIDKFRIKISCLNIGTELIATTYHYHFGDMDVSKSYLVKGNIPDSDKGVQIPSIGRLQVSIFNTENSLIKVFIVPYDLSDMPRCTKTFIRHSNYSAPSDVTTFNVKWLQSLIQLKCYCSKSGRLYLQNEINVILFQKSDLNTACELQDNIDLKYHDITEIAYK